MTDRLSTGETLVEFLLADTDLADKTERRIWAGSPYPPKGSDYKPNDGSAICFTVVSGVDDETDLLRHERVQFKCYAETSAEADILAGVLHAALNNGRSAKVKWARRTITPREMVEPESGWTFSLVQYTVMVHQEE